MAGGERYEFGPPPLSDEDLRHIEEIFRYSRPAVQRCIDVLARANASAAEKEEAIAELERERNGR